MFLVIQDEDDNYDCEIDMDELLDFDEDIERRLFVQVRDDRLLTRRAGRRCDDGHFGV